jgi:hypothetical protein
MVGGFNTNVRYRGRVFHIQTEDSGPSTSRVVVTLVYEGGVILSSKKTRHDASVDPADRQRAVRELMESQHAEIVRALRGGELDTEVGVRTGSSRPAAGPTSRAQGSGASAQNESGRHGASAVKPADVVLAVDRFGQGLVSDVALDRVVLAHLGIL